MNRASCILSSLHSDTVICIQHGVNISYAWPFSTMIMSQKNVFWNCSSIRGKSLQKTKQLPSPLPHFLHPNINVLSHISCISQKQSFEWSLCLLFQGSKCECCSFQIAGAMHQQQTRDLSSCQLQLKEILGKITGWKGGFPWSFAHQEWNFSSSWKYYANSAWKTTVELWSLHGMLQDSTHETVSLQSQSFPFKC